MSHRYDYEQPNSKAPGNINSDRARGYNRRKTRTTTTTTALMLCTRMCDKISHKCSVILTRFVFEVLSHFDIVVIVAVLVSWKSGEKTNGG